MAIATHELIALLLPEGEAGSSGKTERERGTLLVRRPDGQMSLEPLQADTAFTRNALTTGCFRRGTPIIDPRTREVMGYEMEMVSSPHDFMR